MNSTITNMERIAINIRVSNELREALNNLARRENVSVSKLVLVSLAKQYPELNDLVLKH